MFGRKGREMTYWHMQLHPTDEEDNYDAGVIVKETGLIGMGYWKKGEPQLQQFQDEMKIGDIVLVRNGSITKALVEVMDDFQDIGENRFDALDWFQFRRKIKILALANDEMPSFPQPRKTLQRSINQHTQTYQYIDGWNKRVTYAIKNIFIEKYKMFKDFNIDFIDENSEAVSIVVIAGINGSGKTSLLEYIDKISDRSVYFPVGSDKIEDIKETILQKYIDRAFEIDKPSEALKELQFYIQTIFESLDLTFNLSRIDYTQKEVLFKDNSENEFDISELSTGEKTLLSKILYLFFEDYKNRIILIDEPELSLHPSWQNKILQVYKKFAETNNCQIIIATHSPHVIGSAKNEYLRILRKKEDGSVEVIDNLKAYGRDINSILFDVMGEVAYRPREFDDKIDKLYMAIDDRKFEEAKERLSELKKDYGEKDTVVQEAEMLIDVLSSEE